MVADSAQVWRVELIDGTVLTGGLVRVDDRSIVVRSRSLGEVVVDRTRVRRMERVEEGRLRSGRYWFPNAHTSRYLMAPSAIPLHKGEGYYQNADLLLNSAFYGITEHLSVGGGFELLSLFGAGDPIFYLSARYSGAVAEQVHVGGALFHLSIPGDLSDDSDKDRTGITAGTAMVTLGDRDANLTVGTGLAYYDGEISRHPVVTVSGMVRFSPRTAFVSENWLLPDQGDLYPVFSYGLRFGGERMAVDVAFINNADIAEAIVIGVPFVDLVVKF